jgi:hypothetical protein
MPEDKAALQAQIEQHIYEMAKERNQGREPDELHLAYELELARLRTEVDQLRHRLEVLAHAGAPEVENVPWVHGTRLGREHRSLDVHLVEDHGADPDEVAKLSDGGAHGDHDGRHGETWAYAKDLPHPAPNDPKPEPAPAIKVADTASGRCPACRNHNTVVDGWCRRCAWNYRRATSPGQSRRDS